MRELAPSILDVVLTKIESGRTPEKIAENDYLMKCAVSAYIDLPQSI